jgi:hypothetical protein
MNSLSLTTTKGLLSPYNNLSIFPTSMDSSDIQQQQQMNTLQQSSLQPTQQDLIYTTDYCNGGPLLTPTYYSPSPPQPPSFPLMKQSPNSSSAPSNRISPRSSNITPENVRALKCDQCPQSFNRNHDLKRHKRIHLAVKPFPCGNCEKSYSRKDALQVCTLFDLIRRLEARDS